MCHWHLTVFKGRAYYIDACELDSAQSEQRSVHRCPGCLPRLSDSHDCEGQLLLASREASLTSAVCQRMLSRACLPQHGLLTWTQHMRSRPGWLRCACMSACSCPALQMPARRLCHSPKVGAHSLIVRSNHCKLFPSSSAFDLRDFVDLWDPARQTRP